VLPGFHCRSWDNHNRFGLARFVLAGERRLT
jgi:hypothetical protein